MVNPGDFKFISGATPAKHLDCKCVVLRTLRSIVEDGEAVDEDGESVEDGKEKQSRLQGVGLKTIEKYIKFLWDNRREIKLRL